MTSVFGAQGIYPTPRGQPTQVFDLQPGLSRLIPAGTWNLSMDPYSCFQEFDPVTNQWQAAAGGESSVTRYINSDGFNFRVINLSGCIVGAAVTTAGSGYSAASPPVVSFTNSASAAATAIVGGAVSTAVTVTNGGSGYLWAPLVFLDAPPQGAGYQATATCAITNGAVSSVTINNQGAGYTNVPTLYFINDPRDTVGAGASAVATLTGAGTVTQLIITNWGTPSTTLQPTISFSTGAAAAFPIMVRSVGTVVLGTPGSGYSGAVEISALGNGYTGAANVLTNPRWTTGTVRGRKASILVGAAASGGALTTGGQSLLDGGIYAGSGPTAIIYGGGPLGLINSGAIVAVPTFTWANPTSTISLYPV